jgi:hypothetical protein
VGDLRQSSSGAGHNTRGTGPTGPRELGMWGFNGEIMELNGDLMEFNDDFTGIEWA